MERRSGYSADEQVAWVGPDGFFFQSQFHSSCAILGLAVVHEAEFWVGAGACVGQFDDRAAGRAQQVVPAAEFQALEGCVKFPLEGEYIGTVL